MTTQEEIDAYEQAQEELYAAEQSVIDAASDIEDNYEEHGDFAMVPLGMMQDLNTALDFWRSKGGQTTSEREDALDMFYGKGTGVIPVNPITPPLCGHPSEDGICRTAGCQYIYCGLKTAVPLR